MSHGHHHSDECASEPATAADLERLGRFLAFEMRVGNLRTRIALSRLERRVEALADLVQLAPEMWAKVDAILAAAKKQKVEIEEAIKAGSLPNTGHTH